MNTKVLNMYGNRTESIYRNVDFSDCNLISKRQMPFALINVDDNTNKKSYIMDENSISIDDLIDKLSSSFNYKNYYDLNLLLSIISYKTYINGDNFIYTIAQGCSDNRKFGRALLSKYFEAFRVRESISEKVNKYIIPVPDSLEIQAQDRLLKAAKSLSSNTLLLWRSVAVCIGAEDEIEKRNLKEGDKVLVVDFHGNGIIESIITLHDYNGRLIPGHKMFYDCKTKERKRSNYPQVKIYKKPQNNSKYLPYKMDNGFLCYNRYEDISFTIPNITESFEYSLVIVVGNGKVANNLGFYDRSKVIYDRDEKLLERGAALFSYRQEHQIVSYYDECDSLSLVVTTAEEEVALKTLIKGSDKIEGGIRIQSDPIEGIFLPKGQASIKFYLLMGDDDKLNSPLKILEQDLNITDDLINDPKEIPLVLNPSMIAGQGQAFVDICAKNIEDVAIFPTVSLDWEKMDDAISDEVDSKNNKNIPITVKYLEEKLERTFPVNIPPVTAVEYLNWNQRYVLKRFIEDGKIQSINFGRWVNPNAPDLERFERINLFGSPRANEYTESVLLKTGNRNNYRRRDLSLPADGIIGQAFLDKLKKIVDKEFPYFDAYLGMIAWSYHPNYFTKVKDFVLNEVCNKGYSHDGVKSTRLTLCANLLDSDDDILKFIRAFIARIKEPSRISNWARVGYQVLMYNTTFMKKLTFDECYSLMNRLLYAYEANFDSEIISKNLINCMLYTLKIRRYHNSFCKMSSMNDKDINLYNRMQALIHYKRSVNKVIEILKKYLNGKGNLDIPLDDISDI